MLIGIGIFFSQIRNRPNSMSFFQFTEMGRAQLFKRRFLLLQKVKVLYFLLRNMTPVGLGGVFEL
jgi:hypothetical protein